MKKIIPNPNNIADKIDFSNALNISDVNKLLSSFSLNYEELPIQLIRKIQSFINKNIEKINNHEITIQKQTNLLTKQNKFLKK